MYDSINISNPIGLNENSSAITNKTDCPQYVTPAQGWCANGKIVSGGRDKNNCERKPICVYNDSNNEHILGASCSTVTPGYQNECCINKGYSGWNETEFKCIGEQEDNNQENAKVLGVHANNKECEAWNCTKWTACLNETRTRKCTQTLFNCTTDKEKPILTKNCHEKEELKNYNKTRDCPENCICSGSTIKCTFENGTRVMTIYAGKSGNVIVQIQNLNMSTNVTLYKTEDGKIYGIFKNNETREIILPDKIKERMQNRTKVRFENESIDLNAEGEYHMNATKKAKLFFMFPVKERVEFNINSETGEVTKTKTKWWGFLARDVKEKDNSSKGQ
jgi:hypothetical protein